MKKVWDYTERGKPKALKRKRKKGGLETTSRHAQRESQRQYINSGQKTRVQRESEGSRNHERSTKGAPNSLGNQTQQENSVKKPPRTKKERLTNKAKQKKGKKATK